MTPSERWYFTRVWSMTSVAWLGKIVYALGTLLAIPLIAYGILRTKLFDIDLRIRWTIKQSTVAAMPNTENTPEYAMFRKMQVYEAALTDAEAIEGELRTR